MKVQEFYEEMINQAEKLGLPALLAGFSLYLSSGIDNLYENEDETSERLKSLLKLASQIDSVLEVVIKKD